MGRTSRALSLALALAACLVVAPAAASAETGGHFTSETAHTAWEGTEVKASGHTTKFAEGSGTPIECGKATYSGTTTTTTVTEVALAPTYSGCRTSSGTEGDVIYDINGCSYVLKIGKKASTDNTMQLSCPVGKQLEITHFNCTIKLPPQTFSQGVAYTKITESGKPALTIDFTAQVAVNYEDKACIFLGTNHTFNFTGSIILTGKNTTGGVATGIEAIGSEERRFRFENSHTALTGTKVATHKMTFGVLLGTVECSTATLDGTAAATTSTQITVIPAYGGCSGSGREWTTHTNGCAYIITNTGSESSGQVDIECPAGKSIETTIDKFPEGCTITIPAQTAGGAVDYKEEGAGTGRDLLLTWTLEGIKYTRDGCEVGGEGNNGTMSGSITLSGEDTSGNPKGIWIE
ncbi:MAG TPA: hypothetical protein VGB06_09080 [Solirubrobacterales bacterium]|jgi:hypothetical protein